MSLIDCYEPDFVRQFLSRHPQAPQHVEIASQNEIRQSLMLDDADCCAAMLNDPHAFKLHVSQQENNPAHPALSLRDQALNQASLNTITLPGLTLELRLYALGIMLSYASKLEDKDDATLEKITSLPQILAGYAENGKLQEQFSQLPGVPQLQRYLLTQLGNFEFDWDKLPESMRKLTLPLQVSLLMMQDANSEALLQQQLQDQWQTTYETYFAATPWFLSNYLIYRLYHDIFPHHETNSAFQRYFELTTDYFLLRTLFSLWTMDESSLSQDDIFTLFAIFEGWRNSEDAASARLQLANSLPGDHLLSAFSLLTR
ncbi:TPA: lysine-N-methylase [Citrobacter freundii]